MKSWLWTLLPERCCDLVCNCTASRVRRLGVIVVLLQSLVPWLGPITSFHSRSIKGAVIQEPFSSGCYKDNIGTSINRNWYIIISSSHALFSNFHYHLLWSRFILLTLKKKKKNSVHSMSEIQLCYFTSKLAKGILIYNLSHVFVTYFLI